MSDTDGVRHLKSPIAALGVPSATLGQRSDLPSDAMILSMKRASDGRITYQLVFLNAASLDDQISAETPFDVGDRIDLHDRPESFRDAWEVGDIWASPDGEPDILVMDKPPAESD